MTNVNKVPTYINNAMDNLEMLFSGISKNKALDLEIVDEDNKYTMDNIKFTRMGVLVKIKNPITGKPFDVMVMENSNMEEFRRTIVEMAENLVSSQMVDTNISNKPKEEERIKTSDLKSARLIIDAMSNSQKKYEISQAKKKGFTLEQHIAEKKLVSIK